MRDIAGLAILFIMPLFLIVVVTLTQENALKTIKGSQIRLLLIDEDNSPLSKTITEGLDTTSYFEVIRKDNSKVAVDAIAGGKYQIGIFIPKNSYNNAVKRATDVISTSFAKAQKGETTNLIAPEITDVMVYLDPAINDAYKNSVVSSLKMIVQGAEIKILTDKFCSLLPGEVNRQLQEPIRQTLEKQLHDMQKAFAEQVKKKMGRFAPQAIDFGESDKEFASKTKDIKFSLPQTDFPWKPGNVLKIKEEFASKKQQAVIKPSVVQNNVPAFALFAMFFIVIPLSGSLITERNEGAYNRLRTLPVSYFSILSAKTAVYLMVCIFQLLLMIAVGVWFFPAVFHMPALQLGTHYMAIIITVISSALAAIGFGLLIGTLANTIGQAAMFGSLFVVILSILGGIFIPVYLMPAPLKAISIISPIRWGLDSFLDIFVRQGSLAMVFPNILRLILFYAIAQTISLFSFVKRN